MAKTETKMITKNEEEFKPKREAAQKLTFEQLQQLIQRDVTKTLNKTYTQYTQDLTRTYLQNPASSLSNIIELSRFMERNSTLYKKILTYYATAPLFYYSLIQENDLSKTINASKSLKDYYTVAKYLNNFNIKTEFFNAIYCTVRDGIFVGFVYTSEEGTFMLPLDSKYCRVYGKTSEGQWIVYFDATYFNSGSNKVFVTGDEEGNGAWDDVFVDGFHAYEADTNARWFRLPPERTFCMIAGSDDQFDVPLPLMAGLFIELMNLEDLESLVNSQTELENYKILVSKIPLVNGTDSVDDFAISLDLATVFNQQLAAQTPELVAAVTSPMDLDVISFDKSNTTKDTDDLAQSINNLFNNAGVSQLVVAGGSSSNSIALSHAIQNDMANVWIYVNRIESWLNYFIKMNISEGYRLRIHHITWYNRDTYIGFLKECATLGDNPTDYIVCATGKTPYEVINNVRFNATVLNINQWLVPLSSTYTKSGNDEGGAPTKSEEEITSEETVATRDGNKNAGTSANV